MHEHDRLLSTMTRLLSAPATDLAAALTEATDVIAGIMDAEKVDAFVFDEASETMVALGTSRTPLGAKQQRLGLDRLPCANGGRVVQVYRTGEPHLDGQVDQDLEELRGIREGLGIRSSLAVRYGVGERRGVLLVSSTQPDRFSEDDLKFLQAVAHWVGTIAHRAELVEETSRRASQQARVAVADELVTVLAHDLRNHLHPLALRLAVLRRRAAAEGREKDVTDLDAAQDSVGRLGRMVSDLLDVARIDNGLLDIAPTIVRLDELARDVAAGMSTPAVPVRVDVPCAVEVPGDAARLRQVLENILSNAVRHSPKNAPVVVQVEPEPEGGSVRLCIQDRGPGIAPELLPRLFERFARGPGGGLGLGLYLAEQITTAHGGRLEVRSDPRGTRFELRLPTLRLR